MKKFVVHNIELGEYLEDSGENGKAVYLASEADAKLKEYDDDNLALSQSVVKLGTRIVELEKALRTVSIIDLGFGVPGYFCTGCISYGGGPELISHKADCIVARTLSLMER